MVPQLRRLEERFPNDLLVIGVHSAKYTTEGKDRHLRQAILRLGMDHPVVNDHEMRVWSDYAVRAWPTLMFIGPDGRVIGKHEGEFDADELSRVIEQIIDEARSDLRDDPRDWLDPLDHPTGELAFPMAVRMWGDTMAIADTGHHRVLVTDPSGTIKAAVGDGTPGLVDGPFDVARFHHPHGLWIDADRIIVADTGNHSLRLIDLASGRVSTLAGTGEIAHSYSSGGPALETPLRSPWDVAVNQDDCYISMAGNHQLWHMRLGSDEIRRYAGTGHEGRRDGPIASAWLAQPEALEIRSSKLYFCDAETSSIRRGSRNSKMVETLVGQDLFDWGDVDGPLDAALLQHPAGIANDQNRALLYVSDTYNNKIKCIDQEHRVIETLAGTGEPGYLDGPLAEAQFFEPHGLFASEYFVLVADTNNHYIRHIDLLTHQVSTFNIRWGADTG